VESKVVRLKFALSLSKIVTLLMIGAILLGCAAAGTPPAAAPAKPPEGGKPAPAAAPTHVKSVVVTAKPSIVPASGEPPPPQVCDPQNPDFVLAPFDQIEVVGKSRLGDKIFAAQGFYANPKTQQRFRLTANSQDQEFLLSSLRELRICFEAIATEATAGFPMDPWDALRLDQILIEEVMKATGLSPAELAKYNTLADAIKERGGDVDKVLISAIERAKTAIDEAFTAGDLAGQQAQEAAVALESAYRDALYADGAPTLFEGPKDEAQILLEDRRNLIVDMEWLRPTEASEKSFVVYYVIHPSINRNQVRSYRAKCQQSARVRIRADAGSMTVYFWGYLPAYFYIGSRTASASGTSYPSAMSCCAWAPNPSTYDVSVTGWQNGSSYTIEGGWSEGSGGGCG